MYKLYFRKKSQEILAEDIEGLLLRNAKVEPGAATLCFVSKLRDGGYTGAACLLPLEGVGT